MRMLQIFKKNFPQFSLFFLSLIVSGLFLPYSHKYLYAETSNLEEKSLDKRAIKDLSLERSVYILGTGDLINLDFISMPTWSGQYNILNDGFIQIPTYGPIYLLGKSLKEAEDEIEKSLKDELIIPDVQISILRPRPLRISIIGEISRPGLYTFSPNSNNKTSIDKNVNIIGIPTLFDALKQAGGITEETDLSNITLMRKLPSLNKNRYKKTDLNIISLIKNGDQEQNPFLFDGDIISLRKATNTELFNEEIYDSNILPNEIKVTISGEIPKPGVYNIKSSSSLNELIMISGGLAYGRANKYNIELIRFKSNGSVSKKAYKFDLNGDINSKNNPKLVNEDIVRVRRNILAKTGDGLRTITDPLRGAVTSYSLFKIIAD